MRSSEEASDFRVYNEHLMALVFRRRKQSHRNQRTKHQASGFTCSSRILSESDENCAGVGGMSLFLFLYTVVESARAVPISLPSIGFPLVMVSLTAAGSRERRLWCFRYGLVLFSGWPSLYSVVPIETLSKG